MPRVYRVNLRCHYYYCRRYQTGEETLHQGEALTLYETQVAPDWVDYNGHMNDAAFALVFISSSTELTATLLLRPTGVNTLATQFWTYTTNFSYGAAAWTGTPR